MRPHKRISELLRILKTKKVGIRRQDLERRWGCSEKTVLRTLDIAKNEFGIPICFDTHRGAYFLDSEKAVEVPGLWFTNEELTALLTLSHWQSHLGPGAVADLLAVLQTRLEALLTEREIPLRDWHARIRILAMNFRPHPHETLEQVAHAVLKRERLSFRYRGWKDEKAKIREVSPQTLVRYRDHWMLDAYCHGHQGLRCFSLNRMTGLERLAEKAQDISRDELDRHFAEAYGIFGGRARYRAKLIFEGDAARTVAEEIWHPKQKLRLLADGKVRLEFPCADLRELERDLMRYADEVTVEGPEALRKALANRVMRAAGRMEAEKVSGQ